MREFKIVLTVTALAVMLLTSAIALIACGGGLQGTTWTGKTKTALLTIEFTSATKCTITVKNGTLRSQTQKATWKTDGDNLGVTVDNDTLVFVRSDDTISAEFGGQKFTLQKQ